MSWIAVGAAVVGAVAGAQKDKNKSSVALSGETGQEFAARNISTRTLNDLRRMIEGQSGDAELKAAKTSQADFAQLLQQFAAGGFMPNEQDIKRSQEFAQSQFAPQQLALEQALFTEQQNTARIAGQLGRSQDDPILRAKLAQTRAQGTAQIQSQQQAFAAQLAQNAPMQRLGFQQQLTDFRSGLATQALQNRQTLLSLGREVQSGLTNKRIQTATTTRTSGGGMQGAVTGAIGGFGAGAGMSSSFSNLDFSNPFSGFGSGVGSDMGGGGSGIGGSGPGNVMMR